MISAAEAVELHPGLLDWLLHGETGVSSKTIASHLTGHEFDDCQGEPEDVGDFRRCEGLLRQVPTLRSLLPEMAELSPWWAYLVDNWNRIVATYACEIPEGTRGHAPKTLELIRAGRGAAA